METLYPLLYQIQEFKEAAIAGRPVPIESLFRMEAHLLRVYQLARRNTAIASAAMEITSGGEGGGILTLASVCHRDAGEAARIMGGIDTCFPPGRDDWALLSRLAKDPSHEIRVAAHLAAEDLGH